MTVLDLSAALKIRAARRTQGPAPTAVKRMTLSLRGTRLSVRAICPKAPRHDTALILRRDFSTP